MGHITKPFEYQRSARLLIDIFKSLKTVQQANALKLSDLFAANHPKLIITISNYLSKKKRESITINVFLLELGS